MNSHIKRVSDILVNRSKSPPFFNPNGSVIRRRILGDHTDFERNLSEDASLIPKDSKFIL